MFSENQKYVKTMGIILINLYDFEKVTTYKLQIWIYFTFSKVKAGTRSSSTDCKQSRQTDSSKTKRCTEFDSTVAISQTFIHRHVVNFSNDSWFWNYFYTPTFSRIWFYCCYFTDFYTHSFSNDSWFWNYFCTPTFSRNFLFNFSCGSWFFSWC